jgi:zinc D-Ala-D-Ala carboxypeptidase
MTYFTGPTMVDLGAAAGAVPDGVTVFDDESWHHELRPEATAHGCRPMYADPTHDPRMQQ